MHKKKNVAVIGGGASGTVFMIYLAKHVREQNKKLTDVTFHLIDPAGFGNGGIAFGQCGPTHIVNTQRDEMSPWNPTAFADYVISKGRSVDKYTYDLRSDCFEFLQAELQNALEIVEVAGATLVKHNCEALIRAEANGTYSIVDASEVPVDNRLCELQKEQVILTVGYGPNGNFNELKQYINNGYIHSLYPVENILHEPALQKTTPRVAVAGSAAALYDFILACPRQAGEIELLVFSSNGEKAQEVREVETAHLHKPLELIFLKSISEGASPEDIETAINQEFAHAEELDAGPETWVAFNIMNMIGSVLERMSVDTAVTFGRSLYFQKLKRLGGPTSRSSAALLETFNPTFIPTDIFPDSIKRQTDDSFCITVSDNEYTVDCIVNATGHGRHNGSLLTKMKQDGLAEIHPKLGTLVTDVSSYRLTPSGISCIGPATHFGIDGIYSFALPTEKLVLELVEKHL